MQLAKARRAEREKRLIKHKMEETATITDFDGQEIKGCTVFKYLGTLVPEMETEILTRVQKTKAVIMQTNKRVWKRKFLRVAMKRKLCQTLAMSILLYNCETWVLNEAMIQKLKKAYDWCIKIAMNIPFNVREAETGKQTSSSRQEGDDGQKQTNNEDKNVKAEQYKRESYDEFAIRYGFQPVLELIRQRRLI